jgi:hypothetical protein
MKETEEKDKKNGVAPDFRITFVSFLSSSFYPWSPASFAHVMLITHRRLRALDFNDGSLARQYAPNTSF